MLKLIIADDEILVCQLIKKMIAWDEIGIEVIAEADNGIATFNLIMEHKPDIVITDIRMPGLDGLEMIGKVRELNLNTRFIIISGYKHFEYARKALRYGVEDYIPKPINKDELTNVLKKLKERILENKQRSENEQKIRERLALSTGKMRKQFMESVVLNTLDVNSLKAENLNHEYQFQFEEGYFQFVILKIDHHNIDHGSDQYETIILEKVTKVIEKYYEKICHERGVLVWGSRIVCLLNYPLDNACAVKRSFKHLYEDIKGILAEYDSFYLTIGLGTVENNIGLAVSRSFSSANYAIKSRVVLGIDRIIDAIGLVDQKTAFQAVFTKDREAQLKHLVETFNSEGLMGWLDGVYRDCLSQSERDPAIVVDVARQIVEYFFILTGKADLHIDNEALIKAKVLTEIDNARSARQVIDNLFGLINDYLDTYLQSKRMQDQKPIRMARQYIADNYRDPITLEDIAKIVFLNPVYFSVIFKKEMGVNFSEYLTNYRLDMAKELLKETNYNIYEIADLVGYKDPKYFSKLFGKVVGIKPLEYRKLYS